MGLAGAPAPNLNDKKRGWTDAEDIRAIVTVLDALPSATEIGDHTSVEVINPDGYTIGWLYPSGGVWTFTAFDGNKGDTGTFD